MGVCFSFHVGAAPAKTTEQEEKDAVSRELHDAIMENHDLSITLRERKAALEELTTLTEALQRIYEPSRKMYAENRHQYILNGRAEYAARAAESNALQCCEPSVLDNFVEE